MSPEDLLPATIVTIAALFDLGSRRIPNWLTFGGLVGGLLIRAQGDGAAGMLSGLGGASLGLAMLLPFYAVRAVGGGDVKLLAALGALVGPRELLSVALYAAVIGGAMSVVTLARLGRLRLVVSELVSHPADLSRCGARAPYAVAMAGGTYLAMVLPGVVG